MAETIDNIAAMHASAGGVATGPNTLTESYAVRSYEVDINGRLSILAICNFMQDAASKHAQALGVGIRDLMADNHTWVLSRLAVRMTGYPVWQDQIQVSTWPTGAQRLFALRDFEITNARNHVIGVATSAWLVIDSQRRRPVRISPFINKLKPVKDHRALVSSLDKLPPINDYDNVRHFHVRHRDLDLNQHVNNVSYIEWALESLPPNILTDSVLCELEINYLAEAFVGNGIQSICTCMDAKSNTFQHRIARIEDDQELVRAQTRWSLAS